MDKLERYLDQVCRGIGGPRSLRLHIRQELREHLLDAAAEHKAAGMPEEDSLTRAMQDFGGPEQVHSELAATHGERLMAVMIDKAMQWKEMTMKARWLWTTWAHTALLCVIVVEVVFIEGLMIFIVPKFREFMIGGWISPALAPEGLGRVDAWAGGVIMNVAAICQYDLWLLMLAAVIWGLFEWRVRSDNKSLVRLAALGTTALGLLVAVMLTATALILPMIVTLNEGGHQRIGRQIALHQVEQLEADLRALERGIADKDLNVAAGQARLAVGRLEGIRFTEASEVLSPEEMAHEQKFNARLTAANNALRETADAARDGDAERVRAAMQRFHEIWGQVRSTSAASTSAPAH